MKVPIDASILVGSTAAYGRLSGSLNLAAIPMPGALISLLFPLIQEAAPPSDFSGRLRVESVIFQPGGGNAGEVLVALEDLIVPSVDAATKVAGYLVHGFGLHVDEYEQGSELSAEHR